MIERVLTTTIGKACLEAGFESATLAGVLTIAREILADQAIVIECEVEHVHDMGPLTWVGCTDRRGYIRVGRGHRGTPGKALAIILSLGEE